MVVLLRNPLRVPARLGMPLAAATLALAALLLSFGLGIKDREAHAQQQQGPRVIQFPEDRSMGTLTMRPSANRCPRKVRFTYLRGKNCTSRWLLRPWRTVR